MGLVVELPWSNYLYAAASLAMTFIGFCTINRAKVAGDRKEATFSSPFSSRQLQAEK
jgi:hypothetical protein